MEKFEEKVFLNQKLKKYVDLMRYDDDLFRDNQMRRAYGQQLPSLGLGEDEARAAFMYKMHPLTRRRQKEKRLQMKQEEKKLIKALNHGPVVTASTMWEGFQLKEKKKKKKLKDPRFLWGVVRRFTKWLHAAYGFTTFEIKDIKNIFADFKRYSASGELVMEGGKEMVAELGPGVYNLLDMGFDNDLPPLIPRYVAVQANWASSNEKGKSGTLILPGDFKGEIPLEIATNEHLEFYECSLADSCNTSVSLMYQYGIQDFTYKPIYLKEYVLKTNGGSGLEKHEFAHLDCPLDEESGYFVLGKFDEDTGELYLTSFKVPTRHTLFVPPNIIHSNDYLLGTWRTMLSGEAPIDHVHLKKKDSQGLENITLTFEKRYL